MLQYIILQDDLEKINSTPDVFLRVFLKVMKLSFIEKLIAYSQFLPDHSQSGDIGSNAL